MKQLSKGLLGTLLTVVMSSAPALANEPGGGYEGISAMYYFFITVILAYGVYDIFFKKS